MKNKIVSCRLCICIFFVYSWIFTNAIMAQTNRLLSDKVDAEIAYTNSVMQPNEQIDKKIKQNLFVKASLSKNTCTIGEPVLVTYLLYTRLNSQSKVTVQPTFDGCTVYELTSGDTLPEIVKIDDLYYKTYEIRKVAIVPLRTGSIQLAAATIDNDLEFYSPNALKQNISPDIHKHVQIVSNQPTLQVLPLPANSGAHVFNGGIGNFTIRATVAKPSDTINSYNSLQITISGQGNFASLELPEIPWPAGLQHFEHTTSSNVTTNAYPPSGNVVFTLPFSAKQTGAIRIPTIYFTFFNPDKQQYVTLKTESMQIQVAEASSSLQQSLLDNTISPRKYIWIVPVLALLVLVIFAARQILQRRAKIPIANDFVPTLNTDLPIAVFSPVEAKQALRQQILRLLQMPNANNDWYKMAIDIAEKWQEIEPSITAKTIIQLGNEALYAPLCEDFHQSIIDLLSALQQKEN